MSSRYKSKYLVINNTAVANPVLDTVVDLLHFDIPCQNEGLFKYLKMITICILNLFDIHKSTVIIVQISTRSHCEACTEP